MEGNFTAWYVNELEFRQTVASRQKYEAGYPPYMTIRVYKQFNEQTFEGVICMANDFHREKCINKKTVRTNGIYQDYETRKPGYFTFNGLDFFKITSTSQASGDEGLIFFTFRFINLAAYTEKDTAFMVMPFAYPSLNAFYRKHVKDYLQSSTLGISVLRADDFTGTDIIADTILEQIQKAEFIICDITNCNKNVFFEIGYAKGIGKDIIFLLEQNKPADFFDVNHIRRIEYSYERPQEFEKLLDATLMSVRNSRGI
ncbi:hypothetical protein [Mucilaginibacter sp. UYCu711]|uniref:hypothetical protein n=1 Tax=Mucilaginibacter sp. UYCu711 TaxID=3156339 RepID=UPI003D23C90E